jgi:hypothetical protein
MSTRQAIQTFKKYLLFLCLINILSATGCSTDNPSTNNNNNSNNNNNNVSEIEYSLDFGHTSGSNDFCNDVTLDNDFGNGVLFSVWTKITQTIESGETRGNMNILRIYGDNWGLICLDGNIGQNEDGTARYNANFMLELNNTYVGDFCTYYSLATENISLEDANGWVWVAWQVVVNSDKSMTLRQWLKFGVKGSVFPAGYWNDTDIPGEEILIADTTSIEGWSIPDTFIPSIPRSIRIGDDNTYSGVNTPSNSYLYHARLAPCATKPTLEELEAIAVLTSADTTAWGDWELNWLNETANISDRSGNKHDLTIQSGGALYQGAIAPEF